MASHTHPRRRSASGTLIITFLLGIGLGFSVGFALAALTLGNLEVALPNLTAALEPEVVEPVEQERALPDVHGLWPGRHLFIGIKGTTLDEATAKTLSDVKPGGIVLRAENIIDAEQTRALVGEIRTAVGLGDERGDVPLILVSQEGGAINPLKLPPDQAPSAQALGATEDPAVVKEVALRYAQEARARGIGVILGPMLDVYKPGLSNPNLEARTFGAIDPTPPDPADAPAMLAREEEVGKVTLMGLAFAEALLGGGVIPVVKHYPGLGDAVLDQNDSLFIEEEDGREIARFMLPFNQAATMELPGILAGHIALPFVDQGNVSLPASLSPVIITGMLRDKWQYKHVVIADDVTATPDPEFQPTQAAVPRALMAGCDAVILLDVNRSTLTEVCRAIFLHAEEGSLSAGRLEQSRARLDEWQRQLKTFDAEHPEVEAGEASVAVPMDQPPVETAPPPTVDATAEETSPEPEKKPEPDAAPPNTVKLEHVVKSGDHLTNLGKKYGVSVADIQKWNDLSDTNVNVGQRLLIYEKVTPTPARPVTPAPPPAAGPAPAPAPAPAPVPPPPAAAPVTVTPNTAAPTPPPAPVAEAVVTAPASAATIYEPRQHAVQEGETLEALAQRYQVSLTDLQTWNSLQPGASPVVGQTLTYYARPDAAAPEVAPQSDVPPTEAAPVYENYRIVRGDTLRKIAEKHKTSVEELVKVNRIDEAGSLKAGDTLKVPKEAAETAAEVSGSE